MSKILNKCVSSMLLGMILLMSLMILPQQLIMAQTIDDILAQRNIFKKSPQKKLGFGTGPRERFDMALNPDTNKIYVANPRFGTVSVLDSNSGNMTYNIQVGEQPKTVAVNSKTNKIYVANSASGTVSVIYGINDTKKRDDIVVGTNPTDIAVDKKLNKIYVANSGNGSVPGTVSVIYGINDTKKRDDIVVGKGPRDIIQYNSFNIPDKIYVANSYSGTVSVIYTDNDTKKRDDIVFATRGLPERAPMAVTRDKIYLVNSLTGNVSVIYTDNDTKKRDDIVFQAQSASNVPTIVPVDSGIYVANSGSTVSVIYGINDTKKRDDIVVGDGTRDIAALDLDYQQNYAQSNKIYVANSGSDTVSVIYGNNDTKKRDDIVVGKGPLKLAVNPITGLIYVANGGLGINALGSLSVINGFNDKIVAGVTFDVSPGNSGAIVCDREYPTNTYLYVEAGIKCIATPNKDFEFSSWSENLGHNSTIILNTSLNQTDSPINLLLRLLSDSPINLLLRLLNIKPNDTSATFVVDRYGSFTANFKPLPPPLPAAYWSTLFSVVATAIVGTWLIPSFIGWTKSRRQHISLRDFRKRIKELDAKESDNDDKHETPDNIIRDITAAYSRGKLNELQYEILRKEMLQHHQKEISKTINSAKNIVDSVKDMSIQDNEKHMQAVDQAMKQLTDAYSQGKVSNDNYTNLKNEISVLYHEIYRKSIIDSLNGKDSNKIPLDKVKENIKDTYAKGNISEQQYNLLIEKISHNEKQ